MGGWEGSKKVEPAPIVQPMTTTKVTIDALRPAESLQSAGVNADHVQSLAQLDENLPPISVHRETMHVIDGMRRLRAATLRRVSTVDVVFFESDETAALLLAVEANTAHGLPLTLADRQTTAQRIIAVRPEMSDLAISATAGLPPKAVGVIRRRDAIVAVQTNVGIGLDGRRLMVTFPRAGRPPKQILAENPNASLHEVTEAAGISPIPCGERVRR